MTRRELSPAMAGSLLLHLAVAAAFMISWRPTRDLQLGAVVPVNIIANADATDLRAAEQAPVEQAAQTEAPVPEAPLESASPAPPAPPKPEVQPKPEKALDLDALAASLARSANSSPARPSSATRGASRPETAAQARPNLGSGAAVAALNGLTEELQRRWNPNCDVEGGRDVKVRVIFTVGSGGQVVGNVNSEIRGAVNAVSQAGAERAVRAVYAASPFRTLPRDFYGERIAVNFNAREACS